MLIGESATDDTAGQIVFQNTPDAQVVSSCYLDGIGTVYFDAVNAFTKYLNGKIAVDVAYGVFKTNLTGQVESRRIPEDLETDADGNFIPPDEAHCDEVRHVEDTEAGSTIETTPFGRVAWVRANLTGVKNANGAFTHLSTNDFVQLDIATGTTTTSGENFYRVWAPVSDPVVNSNLFERARGPMRFRIKRVDEPANDPDIEGISLDGSEYKSSTWAGYNALLLVDNVIASYPPMKAWAIPQGEYVPSGKKNVIGWTGAVSPVKYPAVGETGLKAAAGLAFATNNPAGAKAGWLGETKASMTYRWRYMNQIIENWKSIPLTMQGDRLVSTDDFELPNLIGDVEFKYEVELNAPYYRYLDYSGSKKFTEADPTPGYLERIKKVTSELNPEARGQGAIPLTLPSGGTDFFFRLRAGKSLYDQLEWQLEVRPEGKTACQTNAFWLVSDGTWKTFLRTTTNETSQVALTVGDYEFRIIGLDPKKTFGGSDVTELPWSGKPLYSASNDEGWTKIRIDAVTGALMFQLMESAESADFMTYSIVRSDFQDFALWDDAATTGLYTGAYFEGKGKQSGSSPDARQYPGEFPAWNPGASSNATYWTEKFIPDTGKTPEQGYGGYAAYQPFEKRLKTPNGWQAWNGQWVCAKWRESAANGDMALQLGGDASGGLEFTSVVRAPRGVDQLTLKARIAQMAAFEDFACYFGKAMKDMHDYVVTTRAMMSTTAAATDFDGAGSVSLVGYYQLGKGCYELRAVRIANDTIRLYLYKWTQERKVMKATLLGCNHYMNGSKWVDERKFKSGPRLQASNDLGTSDKQGSAYFASLFMRCRTVSGKAVIEAGIMNGSDKTLADSCSGTSHDYFTFTDSTAGNPLTFGTFGFGSLNCPAKFISPKYYASTGGAYPAVSGVPTDSNGAATTLPDFKCGTGTVSYPSSGQVDVLDTPENMAINDALFRSVWMARSYPALEAVEPTGELELFTRDAQGAGDDEVSQGTQPVSGFKYNDVTWDVRNHEDTLLRLSTADESDDIAVDDVSFNQWCAASYDDVNGSGQYINADFNAKTPQLGCPTNWVYQNGWVTVNGTAHTVDLQPARVKGSGLVQVRAPLMDGYDGRGIGLGQIAFSYRNADPNCVIRVQYAEPINGASFLRDTTATTNGWTDAAVIDFSAPPYDEKRTEGTIVTYVGGHAVRGAMRILVDPGVVKAVVDDPSLGVDYGRITITDFRASDEPALDGRCWWGWNLRTTRDEMERSLDDSLDTQPGLAAALNNDVFDQTEKASDDETDEERRRRYSQHVPFVQSPTFGTNIVGEISFKARKLHPDDPATEVAVLGAKDGGVSEDSNWECLDVILVTNAVFSETYSYKTQVGKDYASFRLAVIGVEEVKVNYRDRMHPAVPVAQRVLIDDVAISEAVRAKLAFRDVSAFRSNLDSSAWDPNAAGNKAEQPMVREPWGVQGEVYAAQLEEEIDMARGFEVRLLWYRGERPWGIANWRNAKGATSVALGRATGADGYLYRSNYANCPKAVIPATVQSTNEVVQYALEVVYYAPHDDTPYTNTLSAGEWETPSWYHGAKYNAPGEPFSAYTILDSVAPGWAWINEINDFGSYNSLWENSDRTRQYVEVAIPQEANIKGWTLRFLDVDPDGKRVVTNVVAKFGSNEVACEKQSGPAASNCVFLVVADEWAKEAGTLDPAKGEVDGYWQINDTSTTLFSGDKGSLNPMYPLAVQLVRPSGVIEHEVLMIGTNFWEGTAADDFDPQKYLDYLNGELGGQFIFAGKEHGGDPNSLGVVRNAGAQPADWTHAMQRTPGRINEGQVIDPTHPTPFGSSVVIYLNIGRLGHILQEVDGVESRESQIIVLQANDPHGVDVTYRVDPWYEMGSVTTNGVETGFATNAVRTYAINVGRNASNEIITVEANAKVDGMLERKYGLTKDNPYTPAVVDWLSGKRDLHGHEWIDADSGVIKVAEYWSYCRNTFVTNLDLTTMYWLDIPPTEGGWILKGGVSEAPQGHFPDEADPSKTNVRYTVFLMISNKLETADWETDGVNGHRLAHPPYVLRGLDPNFTSQDYDPDDSEAPSWTNVTFKVTGFMMNGITRFMNPENHVPLRWFVFNEDSFNPRGHEKAFQSVIDFRYPYTKESPAQAYGVREWMRTHEERPPFFYFWAIDDRLRPAAVEILRADSTYHGL